MNSVIQRLTRFFFGLPMPSLAVQITPSSLSGILLNKKEKKVRRHFFLPLEKDVVVPSFSRKNIIKPDVLERRLREGLSRLQPGESQAACLIPETSLKAFIFDFETLPSSSREREELIRFRVKKQMPLLHENFRLTYDILPSGEGMKTVAALAGGGVAEEYENFFHTFRLNIRALGVPTISLLNFMLGSGRENFILVNMEVDVLTLIAVLDGRMALYRHKPFSPDGALPPSPSRREADIIREVDTTVRFIEDKTGKRVDTLYVRTGLFDARGETVSSLGDETGLRVERINGRSSWGLNPYDREILSPLIGQIG